MPPKELPPRAASLKSPIPPAVAISSNVPIAGPAPFDRKVGPDADEGYSSEGEDPPADYYHGMWRAHDRSRNRDAAERKKQREMVIGWKRSERPERKESGYFTRADEHVFQQTGGYCFANCGAFVYMRRNGFSPAQIICMLKRPAIAAQIAQSQKNYSVRRAIFKNGAQQANEIADVFTRIGDELGSLLARENPSQWQADAKGIAKPGKKAERLPWMAPNSDIIFPQLIGHYPSKTPFSATQKSSFSVDYFNGGNSVVNQPRLPSAIGASSFHQALFANFQAPRKFAVPHPTIKDGRMLTRQPTSLVMLDIGCRDPVNHTEAHGILADFTDSAHPGLFDPNRGWYEPKQGFCYLDFEQEMHSIWEHYTNNNRQNPLQGLRHLKVAEDDTAIFILAYQLYIQSI